MRDVAHVVLQDFAQLEIFFNRKRGAERDHHLNAATIMVDFSRFTDLAWRETAIDEPAGIVCPPYKIVCAESSIVLMETKIFGPLMYVFEQCQCILSACYSRCPQNRGCSDIRWCCIGFLLAECERICSFGTAART